MEIFTYTKLRDPLVSVNIKNYKGKRKVEKSRRNIHTIENKEMLKKGKRHNTINEIYADLQDAK